MLAALNTLTKTKERLIEITADGEITEEELPDFMMIQHELEKMSLIIDSLNLWVSNTKISENIDKNTVTK